MRDVLRIARVIHPLVAAGVACAPVVGPVRPAPPDAVDVVAGTSAISKPSASPTVRAGALAALLNHAYLTVDVGTYEAIRASQFLKERFGVYEERTTKRGDLTYTGVYFYGVNTYFELFNDKGRARPEPYAIAFGVDHEGDAKKVAPTIGESAVTRFLGNAEIPWFKMGTLPREQSKVVLNWIMEYVPEFLARWHNETGTPQGVSRAAVLQRYAAALGDTQATKLLEDITAISMTATAAETDELLAKAHDFGCTVERTETSATIRTGAEEIRITRGEITAITALHFKLRTKTDARELQFGASQLTIKADGTATWTFTPLRGS